MKLLLAVAGLAFGIFCVPAAVSAETVTWDMANELPETNIHSESEKFFAERLLKHSDGQVQIVHHFGAALGYRWKDQFDAVAFGAVPIANTYMGPLSGLDPLFLLSSLPFLATTVDEIKTLWSVAKPSFEKLLADNNQKLLFVSPWPPSGLWGNKPLDSADSLKGLKIRTYDANGSIVFQQLDAAPVQLSFADVVPQLSTGAIDAVLNSAEGGVSAQYWDYLSHYTEISYSMPLNMIHLNLDAFNDLDPALQDAVLKAAAEAQEHAWELAEKRQQENYRIMEEKGIDIVTGISAAYQATLQAAGESAQKRWLSDMGADGEAILSNYREALQ